MGAAANKTAARATLPPLLPTAARMRPTPSPDRVRRVPYREWLRDEAAPALKYWPAVLVELLLAYAVPTPTFDLYTGQGRVGRAALESVIAISNATVALRRQKAVRPSSSPPAVEYAVEWRLHITTFTDLASPHSGGDDDDRGTRVFGAAGRVLRVVRSSGALLTACGVKEEAEEGGEVSGEVIESGAVRACNCIQPDEKLRAVIMAAALPGTPMAVALSGTPMAAALPRTPMAAALPGTQMTAALPGMALDLASSPRWRLLSLYPAAAVPVVVSDRYVWFLGNSHCKAKQYMSVEVVVYDATSCTWMRGPRLERDRLGPVVVAIGTRLFVFGGTIGPLAPGDDYVASCSTLDTAVKNSPAKTQPSGRWHPLVPADWPDRFRPTYAHHMGGGIVRLGNPVGDAYDFDTNQALRIAGIDLQTVLRGNARPRRGSPSDRERVSTPTSACAWRSASPEPEFVLNERDSVMYDAAADTRFLFKAPHNGVRFYAATPLQVYYRRGSGVWALAPATGDVVHSRVFAVPVRKG